MKRNDKRTILQNIYLVYLLRAPGAGNEQRRSTCIHNHHPFPLLQQRAPLPHPAHTLARR